MLGPDESGSLGSVLSVCQQQWPVEVQAGVQRRGPGVSNKDEDFRSVIAPIKSRKSREGTLRGVVPGGFSSQQVTHVPAPGSRWGFCPPLHCSVVSSRISTTGYIFPQFHMKGNSEWQMAEPCWGGRLPLTCRPSFRGRFIHGHEYCFTFSSRGVGNKKMQSTLLGCHVVKAIPSPVAPEPSETWGPSRRTAGPAEQLPSQRQRVTRISK